MLPARCIGQPAGTSLPSNNTRLPNLASHIRVAFSSMVSNTGSSSPGELEMTCRTSEVAVCCCSDSRSSLSRRVFSMAMTAWCGEVLYQLDLLRR